MSEGPARWTVDRLTGSDLGSAAVWASPSVVARVKATLPWPVADPGQPLDRMHTLVVVGGGTLIDHAKRIRHLEHPKLRLVACGSIWGSGAEASPIAVATDGTTAKKVILMAPGVAPDVRVVWPALADTVPERLIRPACGDVWAHAIEALLSPLATDSVVARAGALVATLLEAPIDRDPRWFDLSAEASLVQAASSVGLVHGIAHTLEGPLAAAGDPAGHAALCATFLWPSLRLLQSVSSKFAERCASAGIDPGEVEDRARALHDPLLYERALPLVESRWTDILRDPCTRTNGALVRPGHLEFFVRRVFA
jgi:alcohol dehydrogenase class IV